MQSVQGYLSNLNLYGRMHIYSERFLFRNGGSVEKFVLRLEWYQSLKVD